MKTAAAQPQPEIKIWVVSADRDDAERWGVQLCGAGLNAEADTDLRRVLACGPEAVLVDPTDWEPSCRRILKDLASQASPPPAVLFLASDPSVLVSAGPAYGCLPPSAPLRNIVAALGRARRAWREFVRRWPMARGRLSAPDEARIKGLLRAHAGLELRADRQGVFEEVVRERMVARLIFRSRDYADLVARSKGGYGEVDILAQRLAVGETYFWRYAGQFLALQEVLIPELLGTSGASQGTFRVWSAGCSTGEEAYSVAMGCRQALPDSWLVEVHATDFDRSALDRARRGTYGSRTLRNLPAELRDAYLEPDGEAHRVRDGIRELVEFHPLNLVDPAADGWAQAHGPFHAVFCRNVLIYLSRIESERLLERFERSLVVGGGLFLGAAETLPPGRAGTETVRANGSFFFRKVVSGTAPAASAPTRAGTAVEDPRTRELYALGLAKLDDEDFTGADVAFEELLRLFPDDARGHTGKALLLANQGREVEAGEQLDRAVGGYPELAETDYLRGVLAEREGREGEALRHYQAALLRDPRLFMAHLNRAWIYKRLGREQQCAAELEQTLGILRQRPAVPRWLTGGLGWEALMELAQTALSGARRRGDRP